jgi:hypothetical protein
MGKIVRLILLSVEIESTDDTTAEDAALVATPELPPRVSVGIFASECFRCLIFEVVCAIVVGVFNDRFFRVPEPLFFEGRESAVPALTPL